MRENGAFLTLRLLWATCMTCLNVKNVWRKLFLCLSQSQRWVGFAISVKNCLSMIDIKLYISILIYELDPSILIH
jgi:hypothetical protein